MLLATTLASVLMSAVLMVLTAVSRDRLRLAKMESASVSPAIINCLRWDLANAQTMSSATDGRSLILLGHGALDPSTLRPTGRLARVTYRAAEGGKTFHLVREQMLVDDPARPELWRELVGSEITGLWVLSSGASVASSAAGQLSVPSRVRIHVETISDPIDDFLWIK